MSIDAASSWPAPTDRIHALVVGETLYGLALRYYGAGDRWGEIADANGVADPRSLVPGTVLVIP